MARGTKRPIPSITQYLIELWAHLGITLWAMQCLRHDRLRAVCGNVGDRPLRRQFPGPRRHVPEIDQHAATQPQHAAAPWPTIAPPGTNSARFPPQPISSPFDLMVDRADHTSWLTTQAAANRSPVLNSLLAGNLQGIFPNLNQIRRSVANALILHGLFAEFPTQSCREF